jgi:hypothetical protein
MINSRRKKSQCRPLSLLLLPLCLAVISSEGSAMNLDYVPFHALHLSSVIQPLKFAILGFGVLLTIIAFRVLFSRMRTTHVAQLGGLTWKRNQFCRGWLITGDTGSVVQGFEERAARMESDIKDSQKRATELEAKVGSPF